jgi:hypothetical protein
MTRTVNKRKETRASLMRSVEKLRKALVYDRNEECTLLPNGKAVGVCTNSALYMKLILGGVVVGYKHSENPTAMISVAESGHDFLLLEEFIVDIWAAEVFGTPAVVRRSNAKLVKKLYGEPAQWRTWCRGRFESFLTRAHSREQDKIGPPTR